MYEARKRGALRLCLFETGLRVAWGVGRALPSPPPGRATLLGRKMPKAAKGVTAGSADLDPYDVHVRVAKAAAKQVKKLAKQPAAKLSAALLLDTYAVHALSPPDSPPAKLRCPQDVVVRTSAIKALNKLPPEALSRHAGALITKLDDPEDPVRFATIALIRKLPPAALSTHGEAIAQRLEARDKGTRDAALAVWALLEPGAQRQHSHAVALRLDHQYCGVCGPSDSSNIRPWPRAVSAALT